MTILVQCNKAVAYATGLRIFTLVQEDRRNAKFRIEADGREGQITVSIRDDEAPELELGGTYMITVEKVAPR